MITFTDTIAALATPSGRGAIGIIRLSGDDAEAVAAKVCKGLDGASDRVIMRVKLADSGGTAFDDALACVMRAPRSYTGQTVIEIYAHGSPAVLRYTLEQLYKAGARPAEAGEFTRRALLNGKLDLMQAEAVGDLINSDAPVSARNALGHLRGAVSRQIAELWDTVTEVMAHVAAQVDYPEDDIPDLSLDSVVISLDKSVKILQKLIDSYERGRYIKEGVSVVIAGPPNAGKSSLFNALLGYDRAIVTDIAGTTRDSLEESIIIGGAQVILHDTAGLRDTADVIEAEGVRRSKEIIENARLVIYVVDGSCLPRATDAERRTRNAEIGFPANALTVINKADLMGDMRGASPDMYPVGHLPVSALTGQGLDKLTEEIRARIYIPDSDETFVTNARHARAMERALEGITAARQAMSDGLPPDVALGELDIALDALGELTGRRVSEAVLEQIFERFCVGK
jgi:tRNA modification GTPase